MNNWKKLGLIFENKGVHEKLKTHASNPVPVHITDSVYRIYYSGRDSENRSSVGAIDFDLDQKKVIKVFNEPFLQHGKLNSFYEAGISIGNVYEVDGEKYILFMGWQNRPGEHWRGDVGRIRIKKDFSLELDSEIPFLSVDDDIDKVSLSYPWVSIEDETFHMWYGSTKSWEAGNGEMEHVINYATSKDGHSWNKKGQVVPSILGEAQAFSKPTVIGTYETGYRMWFSYRGNQDKYKIGYAYTSPKSSIWNLSLSQAGIKVSLEGWDSEMVEYPYVFKHKGDIFMLYNGNSYGKSGFGLAILES